MSGVIRYEAWLLMLSLATGGWLMLVYDTLRVFRLMIDHGRHEEQHGQQAEHDSLCQHQAHVKADGEVHEHQG